jgi:hypothetical protein
MAGRGWVVVPSAEAVIGVFNPQLKLMNNDWFKCTLQNILFMFIRSLAGDFQESCNLLFIQAL